MTAASEPALIDEIQALLTEPLTDTADLESCLERLDVGLARHGWNMPHDRALALGVHMVAAIRRLRSGERLDEIAPEILAEASPSAMEIAEQMLVPLTRDDIQPEETFLAAIHIDSAQLVWEEQQ